MGIRNSALTPHI